MNRVDDNKKLTAKDDRTPIELTTIVLNDEEWDVQELISNEDVHIQPALTATTPNNFQQQVGSDDVGVSIELTAIGSGDKETNDWREGRQDNKVVTK